MASNTRAVAIVLLLVSALIWPGCTQKGPGVSTQRPIDQVLKDLSDRWISLPGVVAVAQTSHSGRPCILVLCTVEPQQLHDFIPSSVEGYQVIIQRTDQIKALD